MNPPKAICSCRGEIIGDAICSKCLGFGWMWADGVPPTMCPGGGAQPKAAILQGRSPTDLPCGRTGKTCPGCDRNAVDIGGPQDRQRTIDWQVAQRSKVRPLIPNDVEHLDPGIKDLVVTLRGLGVKTTDSGDGVSKLPGGYWDRLGFQPYDPADVIPHRHVVIVEESRDVIGPTLEMFLEHATGDWSFDISVIPSPRRPICIVAVQKQLPDEGAVWRCQTPSR